jgi:HlyD family secretion protein
METTNTKLFRQKALDRAASPEQLDQAIKLVQVRNWVPLAALGTLVTAGIVWSIVGRIPVTVAGQGILTYPSSVVEVQSLGVGQLSNIKIKEGDTVKKGDTIATLDQPEIEANIHLQKAKLNELQEQSQTAKTLQARKNIIADSVLVQRRQELQKQLTIAQKMIPTQQNRLQRWQWLNNQGAVNKEEVIKVRNEHDASLAKASDLSAQLRELDNQAPERQERNFESTANHKNQILEVTQAIAQLRQQLKQNSQIVSQHDGQVLELTANPGKILASGDRIGTLETREPSSKLTGLTYFANGDGKQIKPGMKVEITPASVKKERFGGIVGTVTSVSPLPVTPEGVAKKIGNNPNLVKGLMGDDPKIQVSISLQQDTTNPSGFKWSSSKGPQFKITAGTVASVKVITEEVAPLSFVLPIFKSWSGT